MITKIHWWISNQKRPKNIHFRRCERISGGCKVTFFSSFYIFLPFLGAWIQNHSMDRGFLSHRRRRLFFIFFCLFFVSMVWVWKSFLFFSLSFQGNQKTVKMLEQIQLQIPHKDKRNCYVKCNWMWFRFGRKWISPLLRMLHFMLKKRMWKKWKKDDEKKLCSPKQKKFPHGFSNGANPLIKIIVEKKKDFFGCFLFRSVFNLAITLTIYDCFYGILCVISLNAVFFLLILLFNRSASPNVNIVMS